jgi:hypothetical protein
MLRECPPGGTGAAADVRAGIRRTQWVMHRMRMPRSGARGCGGGRRVGMARMSRLMMLTGRFVTRALLVTLARFVVRARRVMGRGLFLVRPQWISGRGNRAFDQFFNGAKIVQLVAVAE